MTTLKPEAHGHEPAQPYLDMWGMALIRGLADAITPNPIHKSRRSGSRVSRVDQEDARQWVGSRDFHYVCALAGVEAEAALEWYERVMSREETRAAALQALTGSQGDSRRGNGRNSRRMAA